MTEQQPEPSHRLQSTTILLHLLRVRVHAPQQSKRLRFTGRRRHPTYHPMATCFVATALLLVSLLSSSFVENAIAFVPLQVTQQRPSGHRSQTVVVTDRTIATTTTSSTTTSSSSITTQLQVSHDLRGSWSTPGTTSRLGVRKRVKAVLAKARSRGGKESATQTASTSTSFYPHARYSESLVIPQSPPSSSASSPPRTGSPPSPQPYYQGAATTTYMPRTTDADAAERFLFREASSNAATSTTKVLSATHSRSLTAADDPDDPLLNIVSSMSTSTGEVPLPFTLPVLSPLQKQLLAAGERIQEQSKMGREGSGYVVLDVDAPDYVVWECLLDFERYPSFIGTVREMRLFDVMARPTEYDVSAPAQSGAVRYGVGLETRASFVLSKFRLNIAAVHTYQPHPAGHFMEFTLDKSCRNAVLKHAKGIWHTESNPEGREGITRVWLLCELQVSSVLPSFIVDYTAKKAMPRASNWIRPTVEAKKRELNLS